ncbi:MAG: DNA-protecting protein DprA [Myxococcales bacterium]|nr:DNA-protecting protein DprA [Myxococcales bacterium]
MLARHDSLDQLRTELESGTEALTWLRGESVATLRAALVDASLYARALRETEIARQKGARLLRRGDEGFPETLARAVKPPELVWLWGHTPPTGEMIAIVGARRSDEAGLRLAHQLGADVAESGRVVVSGGALGIENAAHRGAPDAGGLTTSCLGSGILVDYPKQNRGLFARTRQQGGTLSEYSPGAAPHARRFPERNRLIVALASAVLIVRAAERSGALITARLALEQGKAVFVATDEGHERFAGNRLLVEAGAHSLSEFQRRIQPSNGRKAKEEASRTGNPLDQKILDLLKSSPLYYDEIRERTGLRDGLLCERLLELELQQRISRLCGNRYRAYPEPIGHPR